MTLILRTDRALIRAAASSRRYVLATHQAPDAPATGVRQPVSVAIVLDRSGSMNGESKFPLARLAVERALAMLRPEDRFSLVVFDTEIDTLVPSVSATAASRRDAIALLRNVEPRGSTDLCGGWLAGAEGLLPFVGPDRVSRVLLLTDGQANHGTVDPEKLTAIAAELRGRGIATTTLGLGDDFDERLLDALAHFGGGNAYYVERAPQIAEYLTSEIGEALATVARGAALQLELSPGMQVSVLSRYRHAPTAEGGVRVELGDLVSGQETSVVLAVQFPQGAEGTTAAMHATFSGDGALVGREETTLTWSYAGHAENDRQHRDRETDRAVAALYAARARAEATEANRHGDFDRAARALEGTAARIASYARGDDELLALVSALRSDVGGFATVQMSMSDIKASYQSANASLKGRSADGRARRR